MIRARKWIGLLLAGLIGAGACFSGAAITGAIQEETAYAAGDVAIDATNFPDENFRKYVSEEIDTDNDGTISLNEIQDTVSIWCPRQNIISLEGIKVFSELKSLSCHENSLTKLDLKDNKKIQSVTCDNNNISEIDTSENEELKELSFRYNNVRIINLKNNLELERLDCDNNNLQYLDISANKKLKNLSCEDNYIKSIDTNNNYELQLLYCSENNISSIDVSNNTVLEYLMCNGNHIDNIDISKNKKLKQLVCNNNSIRRIVLGESSNLNILSCSNNELCSIDLSGNKSWGMDPYVVAQNRNVLSSDNEIDLKIIDKDIDINMIRNVKGAVLSGDKFTDISGDTITYDYKTGYSDISMDVTLNIINKVKVNDIKLNATNINIEEGHFYELIATVSPEDASIKNVIWSSDDTSVATVDENGKISAIAPGVAMITAETEDGGYRAECLVTVNKKIINAESVALDKKILVLNKGKSQTLTASVKPADATDKTVTWSSSDKNVATVDQTGNVTAVNHGTAKITATTANGKTAASEVRVNFIDVLNPKDWYYNAVYWAAEKGITTGTDGKFFPADSCTREQAITFLWRLAGKPEPKNMASKFSDVKDSKRYSYKAIMWGNENGVITGTDGKFYPTGTCTREQIVTMLWRLAGKPEPKNMSSRFKDVTDNKRYSYKAVMWAQENGITTGTNGLFFPTGLCKRREIVTFIYRYKN